MRPFVGIVTGLRSEIECLGVFPPELRPPALCAGARPERAAAAARCLVAQGCRGLISFGLAGGLTSAAATGDVVVGSAVIVSDGRAFETHRGWRERLFHQLRGDPHVLVGHVAGVDRPVMTPAEKSVLAKATGALAADMESHAVARTAEALGVPFVIIRAVADDAKETVPQWLSTAVGIDGRPRSSIIIGGLCRRPGQIGHLLRLGRQAARGYRSLRGVALRAGPLFQFELRG